MALYGMVYGLEKANQRQRQYAVGDGVWLVWYVLTNKNSRSPRASS
jgi:hypothetical protein